MKLYPLPARIALGVLMTSALAPSLAAAQTKNAPEIETGFQLLYETQFAAARGDFAVWQRVHPDDPLGPAAEAATYLYEELFAQGVFTSEFFLNDKKLLGGVSKPPDPKRKQGFLEAAGRAETLAQSQLKAHPKEPRALLALTMVDGMQSDYVGLIEKHQLETLKFMHRAQGEADKLLAIEPDAQDGYVALGAQHYILGCLPSYKRFFLRIGGMDGDRKRGMKELTRAAEHGHYLAPFAKALLALVALREKQPELARKLFGELSAAFPQNAVFAREFAKISGQSAGTQSN